MWSPPLIQPASQGWGQLCWKGDSSFPSFSYSEFPVQRLPLCGLKTVSGVWKWVNLWARTPECRSQRGTKDPGKYLKMRGSWGEAAKTKPANNGRLSGFTLSLQGGCGFSAHALPSPTLCPPEGPLAGGLLGALAQPKES